MANRKKLNPLTIRILVEMVVLVAVLVLLLVWIGNVWQGISKARKEEDEDEDSAARTSQSETTEAVPEETDPQVYTPDEALEVFMAENGLTRDNYPDFVLNSYQTAAYEDENPGFETQSFLLNYPLMHGIQFEIDISGVDTSNGVPLFLQWDDRWGYIDYGVSICGIGGCGPTCLSMVAYYLTGDPTYTPAYMLDFATREKHVIATGGTDWSLFGTGAVDLGFTVEQLPNVENKIIAALEADKPVVINVGPGYFTTSGHYMVLVGYEDGKFRINDPNSLENSSRLWDWEEFQGCVNNFWAISNP